MYSLAVRRESKSSSATSRQLARSEDVVGDNCKASLKAFARDEAPGNPARIPERPGITTSGRPPTANEMTGVPQAMDSTATILRVSAIDGTTVQSADE
jgi:hypothetical protein